MCASRFHCSGWRRYRSCLWSNCRRRRDLRSQRGCCCRNRCSHCWWCRHRLGGSHCFSVRNFCRLRGEHAHDGKIKYSNGRHDRCSGQGPLRCCAGLYCGRPGGRSRRSSCGGRSLGRHIHVQVCRCSLKCRTRSYVCRFSYGRLWLRHRHRRGKLQSLRRSRGLRHRSSTFDTNFGSRAQGHTAVRAFHFLLTYPKIRAAVRPISLRHVPAPSPVCGPARPVCPCRYLVLRLGWPTCQVPLQTISRRPVHR